MMERLVGEVIMFGVNQSEKILHMSLFKDYHRILCHVGSDGFGMRFFPLTLVFAENKRNSLPHRRPFSMSV